MAASSAAVAVAERQNELVAVFLRPDFSVPKEIIVAGMLLPGHRPVLPPAEQVRDVGSGHSDRRHFAGRHAVDLEVEEADRKVASTGGDGRIGIDERRDAV